MLTIFPQARSIAHLSATWRSAWPEALQVWSRYTRLRDPRLCASRVEAAEEGLSGSFAMIRLSDQRVVVDMKLVASLGLDDYAVEILAHEIGHHVLAPATATDQFRLLARVRHALPTLERHAPLIANLYTDLIINDRLQRERGLRMADIYRALASAKCGSASARPSEVWSLYLRIYEHLWTLDPGELGGAGDHADLDSDAWLGARLVRVYANDWVTAAGRFATLLLPYLAKDDASSDVFSYLHDTRDSAAGCAPAGVHKIEPDEAEGAIHPVYDTRVTGTDAALGDPVKAGATAGQAREPFEYGEILKAAGVALNDHEIAMRYYREQALPHLVRFPRRQRPAAPEPLLEGLEPWNLGDPFDEIDWLQTAIQSPRPIAGMTTARRSYGQEPGTEAQLEPVDLDMYVDSSGSMPDPQVSLSYLALAGAVIALSALRAGARVQVTLWSGKEQVTRTAGFVRDEDAILRVLTGFYGGMTCFPIHVMRETYVAPRPRPTHLLMISDDGITTMFDRDERGNSGWDIAAKALANGHAGGTMALNLPGPVWRDGQAPGWHREAVPVLSRAEREQGWDLHAIPALEGLLEFARAFSRRHYGSPRNPR